jgi:integrase
MVHAQSKSPPRRCRLTELGVKKARPEKTAYLIWDTQQRGLALRVQPTGAASYVVIYRRRNRPRWLHLGRTDAIALGDARTLAAEVMLKVIKGSDPAADKRAERSSGTFAELVTRYIEEHAKKHNRSWKQANALLQRFAVKRWGKLQASSITRDDVKALFSSITSKSVANQTKAHVSAIFNWAIKEQIVSINPAKLINSHETRDRERILSGSELPLFWKTLDALDDRVAAAALKMVLLTGQRPGEVAHMRREHVKEGWWEMPGAPIADIWPGTKNAASHRVWIPKPAQALLGGPSPTGFVFAAVHGGPVNRLDAAMREISKTLGGEKVTPHDLRRTFSRAVTSLGFGRDALNRVTNHKEGGIASIYDRHGYSEEKKRIMEAVAARIMALVEDKKDGKVLPFAR